MTVYSFDQQNHYGERGEAYLDEFFRRRGHLIQEATRGQQRIGIDRVFLFDGKVARVEYKTDFIAHETRRVFIETVSIDTDDKAGWAYTSQADLLVYFIPRGKTIYVVPLEHLRHHLESWVKQYPTRPAQNQTYTTHGILVPISQFAQIATQKFDLSG